MTRMAPTRRGWALLAFAGPLLAVATARGEAPLQAVAAVVVGMVMVGLAGPWWALRGLVVRRVVPDRAYAGAPHHGRWEVEGLRAPCGVRDPDALRRTTMLAGPQVADVWSFPRRGVAPLAPFRLLSMQPLGLFCAWRDVDDGQAVVVWPAPEPGPELRGGPPPEPPLHLRRALPGDRARDLHLRATLRTGQPIVAARSPTFASQPEVVVAPGGARERDLAHAAHALLEGARRRHPVALRLDGRRYPPATDAAQLRAHLDALAAAP